MSTTNTDSPMTPREIEDNLAAEFGSANAIRKFASEQTDPRRRRNTLKLLSPVHEFLLNTADNLVAASRPNA